MEMKGDVLPYRSTAEVVATAEKLRGEALRSWLRRNWRWWVSWRRKAPDPAIRPSSRAPT
jgi:hypothetical protein